MKSYRLFLTGLLCLLLLLMPAIPTPAASEALSYIEIYSSYLGGDGYDEMRDVAFDVNGNLILVGGTVSGGPDTHIAFPTTQGVVQPQHNPQVNPDGVNNMDMFVAKLDAQGKLIWSTFLGGPCFDKAYAVETDRQGYIYIAGRAGCQFPYISPDAFQPQFMGGWSGAYGNQDGILLKLSPDGSQVIWASYFGTSEANALRDIDLDEYRNIYVIGGLQPGSSVSPSIAAGLNRGYRSTPYGDNDEIVAKISPDGRQVLWASLLGGSGFEQNSGSLRVASDQTVFTLTTTNSSDCPTVNAYDTTYNGGWDSYLARLSADGKNLLFATYIGGKGDDFAAGTHNLWIDLQGNPVFSGSTHSLDYPVSKSAFQPTYGGGASGTIETDGDLFVTIISSDGKRLVASTYLGGSRGDGAAEGITVDFFGNIVFSGTSHSADFPITSGAKKLQADSDSVLVILKPDLTGLLYSSFTGGAGLRSLDSAGLMIAGGGMTDWSNWQTTGSLQPYQGTSDATVLLISVRGGAVKNLFLPAVGRGAVH